MVALKRVGRLRIAEEAAGSTTFGAELSGSIASFRDLRYISAEAQLDTSVLEDAAVVQRGFQRRLAIIGPRAWTMNVTLDLVGTGVPLETGTADPAYTDTALGLLLKIVLGYEVSFPGSAEASGAASTATAVTVTTGHGVARWLPGMAMGIVYNGRLHAREVDLRTGDVLTPKVGFPASPTDQTIVYNSHTYAPATDPNTSAQFLLETSERDACYWLLGGQCTSMSIDLTLGQLPRVTFTFTGPDWKQDDEVGTPVGSSAIGVATFTDGDPVPYVNNEVIFTTGSEPYTYAGSVVDPSALSLTFNWAFQPHPSPSGLNGVLRHRLIPPDNGSIVTMSMTLPIDGANMKTLQAARDARTIYALFIQVGNIAGKTVLISVPALQITNVQQADAAPSLHGFTVEGMSLEDQDIAYSSDLTGAHFRFHRL
ncbi:MAG: hypothetical protein IT379_23600 [Deltaproteobacteria bacterium]|nr:hypothetical protein [Deltaproteobacteria bacterium]